MKKWINSTMLATGFKDDEMINVGIFALARSRVVKIMCSYSEVVL
jgi:hypothetical protein